MSAAAAVPSQTKVTDLNCSDHSTTSRNGRVTSFGESPSDTHSRSDSTIHYGVTAILQPTTIATRKKQERRREKKDCERALGFNQCYRRKQITRGGIIPNIFLSHTPAGAEPDLNAAAAAPSQTKVTDLNCSDRSTTSKEMAAWRALGSHHLTCIQDPTIRYTMV